MYLTRKEKKLDAESLASVTPTVSSAAQEVDPLEDPQSGPSDPQLDPSDPQPDPSVSTPTPSDKEEVPSATATGVRIHF